MRHVGAFVIFHQRVPSVFGHEWDGQKAVILLANRDDYVIEFSDGSGIWAHSSELEDCP